MIRRARMTIASLGKRIDSRFRRAERSTAARFDGYKRFDAMGAAIDARFGQVNRNIESIGEKLDGIARRA